MAKNKYVGDYRLEQSMDARGRIKTGYTYIGAYYQYVSEPRRVIRSRRLSLALCGIGFAAFFAALVPESTAMRTIYVSLPFVFTALSLGLLTETVWSAPQPDTPMEHRQADRLANRWPPAAGFTLVLCAIALIGEGINLLRGLSLGWGDAVFCLCAAAEAVCAGILFIKRRDFAARTDQPSV